VRNLRFDPGARLPGMMVMNRMANKIRLRPGVTPASLGFYRVAGTKYLVGVHKSYEKQLHKAKGQQAIRQILMDPMRAEIMAARGGQPSPGMFLLLTREGKKYRYHKPTASARMPGGGMVRPMRKRASLGHVAAHLAVAGLGAGGVYHVGRKRGHKKGRREGHVVGGGTGYRTGIREGMRRAREKKADMEDAPNYQRSMNPESRCGNCEFFRPRGDETGSCRKWDFTCEATMVCDSWKESGPEDEPKFDKESSVSMFYPKTASKGKVVSDLPAAKARLASVMRSNRKRSTDLWESLSEKHYQEGQEGLESFRALKARLKAGG